MNLYEFPFITNIDQVLRAIEGRDEFIVIKKDGYQVVDYVFTTNDTFPPIDERYWDDTNLILRECRGLMFDMDGKLIARRYHKFFNINERGETLVQNINFNPNEWDILEKLDGSMITPFVVDSWFGNNKLMLWGTKKGVTEVSAETHNYVVRNSSYNDFAWFCEGSNWTPIFEWCSRKQRIVVDHPVDRLVLTAIREKNSGLYINYDRMAAIARPFGIEVVRKITGTNCELEQLVGDLKNYDDRQLEGWVLRHWSGHMMKVKLDWYVQVHNTKEVIATEAKVLNLILQNALDDVMPLIVMDVDRQRVLNYQSAFNDWLKSMSYATKMTINKIKANKTRKEFALTSEHEHSLVRSLVFACWDTDDYAGVIKNVLQKNLTPKKKFDTFKMSLGMHLPFEEVELEN